MEKIKTSRESESRKKQARLKDWTPPSSLDAPAAPQGYCHRWIRTQTAGFEDVANVSKKLREGWEFLKAETLLSEIGEHDYPIISDGKYQGLIGVGGLVLARIPEEIVKQRKDYFQNKTKTQQEAVDNDILREQRPEMPINIDRQSRVTFGGGRKSE